ncbi:MAG TPA: hypothetical protein VF458_16620 [Ktedonobacteraceae bacterium]
MVANTIFIGLPLGKGLSRTLSPLSYRALNKKMLGSLMERLTEGKKGICKVSGPYLALHIPAMRKQKT